MSEIDSQEMTRSTAASARGGKTLSARGCKNTMRFYILLVWAIFTAAFVIAFWPKILFGQEAPKVRRANPAIAEWMEKLRLPNGGTGTCCGMGDAYEADETAECSPSEKLAHPECKFVAIVTDTKQDIIMVPAEDGKWRPIHRPHVKPGTRVIITREHQRKPASLNPTDHTIVFINSYGYAICYEPGAKS